MTVGGERRPRAEERLRSAVDCIEEAQALTEQAKRILAPLAGTAPQRKRLTAVAHQLTWAAIAVYAQVNRLSRSRTDPHH